MSRRELRLTGKEWWDYELLQRLRYKTVIRKIRDRARTSPHLLNSAPANKKLSLRVILALEDQLITQIKKNIHHPDFDFSPHQKSLVIVDKPRNLYLADWADKILLMVMASILQEGTSKLLSSSVYSYRKGFSATKAVKKLSRFVKRNPGKDIYIIKRDIAQYTDSISQQKLFSYLSEQTTLDPNSLFGRLLRKAIRIEILAKNDEGPSCLAKGIPSGSPLSPPLANLFLKPLDDVLMPIPNSFYGRFGDDFVFATTDRLTAARALMDIHRIVTELGLQTKPEKELNCTLTRQTSRKSSEHMLPDFKLVRSLEWIGYRIDCDGGLGVRFQHLDRAKTQILKKIESAFDKSVEHEFTQQQKIEFLRVNLQLLLNLTSSPVSLQRLTEAAAVQARKDIVHAVLQSVVILAGRKWGMRKQEAWRLLRRIKKDLCFTRKALPPRVAA